MLGLSVIILFKSLLHVFCSLVFSAHNSSVMALTELAMSFIAVFHFIWSKQQQWQWAYCVRQVGIRVIEGLIYGALDCSWFWEGKQLSSDTSGGHRQDYDMTANLVSGQLTSCPRRGLQMWTIYNKIGWMDLTSSLLNCYKNSCQIQTWSLVDWAFHLPAEEHLPWIVVEGESSNPNGSPKEMFLGPTLENCVVVNNGGGTLSWLFVY